MLKTNKIPSKLVINRGAIARAKFALVDYLRTSKKIICDDTKGMKAKKNITLNHVEVEINYLNVFYSCQIFYSNNLMSPIKKLDKNV